MRVIRSGFEGTEGPVTLPDGSFIFTETHRSRITKIDKDNHISTFLENTNRSNGLGFDSKGRLVSVQVLTVGVVYPKGSEVVLAGPFETRPNDLVVSRNDGIYFTLPGNKPPAVCYISSGGQPVFAVEAPSPHGIQLSPAKGQHLGLIPVSQRPQNLAFAGPHKRTLYIAGQGAMYRLQMLSQGYPGRAK